MITLLTGENSFEIDRELQRIIKGFSGTAERVETDQLEVSRLPDLFQGGSLFASERLVIIKGLSDNKPVWASLVDWLAKIPNEIHIVFVEPKPDKRTATYKKLAAAATLKDYKPFSDRDTGMAEKWAVEEAARQGFALTKQAAQQLVTRVGVGQWALFHALHKLAVVDPITEATITEVIDASPTENVFGLFEAALRGDIKKVKAMIDILQVSEDPFMVFGLLSGQAFQLAALAVANQPAADVAKDIGAHPFVLSKLAPSAKKLGRPGARRIIAIMAEVDDAIKTSTDSPWLLLERALVKIAAL